MSGDDASDHGIGKGIASVTEDFCAAAGAHLVHQPLTPLCRSGAGGITGGGKLDEFAINSLWKSQASVVTIKFGPKDEFDPSPAELVHERAGVNQDAVLRKEPSQIRNS